MQIKYNKSLWLWCDDDSASNILKLSKIFFF